MKHEGHEEHGGESIKKDVGSRRLAPDADHP